MRDTVPFWWHDIHAPPRPRVSESLSADVCVVGLGGSGLAAVRTAGALGASVVGVEAGRIAGAAAGRNGGLLLGGLAAFHHDVAARYGPARATALYGATLDMLREIQALSPESSWWHGSLRIAGDDAELEDCRQQLDRMQQDGLPVEWYEGADGTGLLFPSDGAVQPVRRSLVLAERTEQEGARLFEHSPVVRVTPGRVLLANGLHVDAPLVVVCADGALGTLIRDAATKLRQARLQMLATAPAADVSIPRPVYARYGHDYWQQLPDGRVALGGGRDRYEAAEWTDSDRITSELQRWLEIRLREAVGTAAPVTHRWAATVTFTANGLPIAREFGDGLWGVGGYCGTGNVVGALCARGAVRRGLGHADAFLDQLDGAQRG